MQIQAAMTTRSSALMLLRGAGGQQRKGNGRDEFQPSVSTSLWCSHSRPWLCPVACLSVRGREDFQDCQESRVKKAKSERVSSAPLWVPGSIGPVSSIYYLVQPVMRIWAPVLKTWWLWLNMVKDPLRAARAACYVYTLHSVNCTDLIASESPFIFEIKDCWRQRINRVKGV